MKIELGTGKSSQVPLHIRVDSQVCRLKCNHLKLPNHFNLDLSKQLSVRFFDSKICSKENVLFSCSSFRAGIEDKYNIHLNLVSDYQNEFSKTHINSPWEGQSRILHKPHCQFYPFWASHTASLLLWQLQVSQILSHSPLWTGSLLESSSLQFRWVLIDFRGQRKCQSSETRTKNALVKEIKMLPIQPWGNLPWSWP